MKLRIRDFETEQDARYALQLGTKAVQSVNGLLPSHAEKVSVVPSTVVGTTIEIGQDGTGPASPAAIALAAAIQASVGE